MRIALFVTCLGDVLFPDVREATVTVPERLGHEVVFPQAQTCCGRMHTNTGYQREAVDLVRRHVEVFEQAITEGVEAIVAHRVTYHPRGMVTQEIGLNEALEAAGIAAHGTDLAELIVQLGHDRPSHILVPAIHLGRAEIREIFARGCPASTPP